MVLCQLTTFVLLFVVSSPSFTYSLAIDLKNSLAETYSNNHLVENITETEIPDTNSIQIYRDAVPLSGLKRLSRKKRTWWKKGGGGGGGGYCCAQPQPQPQWKPVKVVVVEPYCCAQPQHRPPPPPPPPPPPQPCCVQQQPCCQGGGGRLRLEGHFSGGGSISWKR
ncbi:uncharacterized protein LOC108736901 [Agrilus planipennis]|uniref:Uncharacterized protein LOC108736901 n=1 Tax=Agrilus planipennis TaxID=224129 RepID=A0A1W4WY71_AGRPL|nr:uncharacterized protein LOC108736901 [Agrilus planipennis]